MTNEHNKMMAGKLYDQMQRGFIDGNDWAETFINDVYSKTKAGKLLTEKQQVKLEELFERY